MTNKIKLIRAPHNRENPYAQLHRGFLQGGLSYEARGLLAYLLSNSNQFEVTVDDLIIEGSAGRDKVYRIIRELVAAGHIRRTKTRNDKGRWSWTPYEVFEIPYTEKPYTEKPYPENQEIKDTKSSSTKSICNPPPKLTQDARDSWYDAVKEVTGLQAGRNVMVQQMLRGTSTRAGYREHNLGIETPEEFREFGRWYRKVRPGMSLSSPATIADYHARYLSFKDTTHEVITAVSGDDSDVFALVESEVS